MKVPASIKKLNPIWRALSAPLARIPHTALKDTKIVLGVLSTPKRSLDSLVDFLAEREDLVASVKEEDPALKEVDTQTIGEQNPGVLDITNHSLAHWFWKRKHYNRAYTISMNSKRSTGIEIHLAAIIGKKVAIDHGSGVVIGQTAIIGDGVTIYQGVIAGATGKEDTKTTDGRRHPKIGKKTQLSSDVHLFGGFTIGEESNIGAGSVIIEGPETEIGNRVIILAGNFIRKIKIGDNTKVGTRCSLLGNSKPIQIGSNVSIWNDVSINGSNIVIGDDCIFSNNVQILGSDITIGNNVKLGVGVRVIGDNLSLPDNFSASEDSTVRLVNGDLQVFESVGSSELVAQLQENERELREQMSQLSKE
jgi:serine O-acetyltransferase